MSEAVEQWWPLLSPGAREWLVAHNGEDLPAVVQDEIARAGGVATSPLPDADVDWIETVANGETGMTVTLRHITPDNEQAVRALRTTPAQEQFVSTVAYSLQEAERNPRDNPWCRAVYAEEQPVGFVMVAWDIVPTPPDNDGPFFLWKLLIDQRHQGKGYGREAVQQVMDLVQADGATELLTSYVEGEGSPLGFYTRLGFVPRGDLDPNGEVMLRRTL